jgi:ATP-dependent helicase/nuclease subunit B
MKIITSLCAQKRLQYLIQRLVKAIDSSSSTDSDSSACLIVPEQFLFETERSMYTLLGARKIAATQITGFSKLAADVIKNHGSPKLYADDIVKGMIMYKTLKHLKKGGSYDFARGMLSALSDLKSAAITPQLLKQAIIEDELLAEKIGNIAEIYETYCAALDVDFADKLDDCRIAAELINLHDCFYGKEVFLYEFDGFSPSQLLLITALTQSAKSVSILLRTDSRMSDNPELRAMNSLIAALERCCPCDCEDLGGVPNSPDIQLWTADNVSDEAQFVARTIRRLIIHEGYTLNQIAILTCDSTGANSNRIKEALSEYDISSYSDLPEPIITKPMTRFIIALLQAVSLKTPKLLSYIRSGFVRVPFHLENYESYGNVKLGRFSPREKRYSFDRHGVRLTRRLSKRSMDLLERAAFRFALTEREWGKPFPQSNRHLHEIEELRKAVVQPLINLRKACKNQTGSKITEILCEFLLEEMQLQRTVLGLCSAQDLFENKNLTDDLRQLWDLAIDVFESLHTTLQDESVSLSEYSELLAGVFKTVNIAKPPQVLDSVVIGDLARSRMGGRSRRHL